MRARTSVDGFSGLCAVVALCTVMAVLTGGRAFGQGQEFVKANYTKYEFRIPMRDGVRLFTSVYVPKDATPATTYPILLNRTPYSIAPYGVDLYKDNLGPSPLFGTSKYIVALQDVRGRWMSEGDFVHMRPIVPHTGDKAAIDESTDAYDTIDWLVKNVLGNNGKVGIWGISYPGFYAAAASIDAHPALVASSPQAPVTDWFVGDDWHHNGAFLLPHAFNFMSFFERQDKNPTTKPPVRFDHGTPDGYEFFLGLGSLSHADERYLHGQARFWSEMMSHGTYDSFWKSRNLRPHLQKIKPAVMTVGGWFDAENHFGALETYKQIESSTPETKNSLVMGPWLHGGWSRDSGASLGNISFNSNTGDYYRSSIEFPFFEHHLKGKADAALPEALVFETGTNKWRSLDSWPPRKARAVAYYLADSGSLKAEAPTTESEEAFDEYVSDPSKPVPFLEDVVNGMPGDYMTADQRFASHRSDVLTYKTEPLENDLTIAGPIRLEFVVSTTGTDSDWVVKLIDVFPPNFPNPEPNPKGIQRGGYQFLVRGDVLRGKFRNSLETPEPFQPGMPTKLSFTLHDVCHTFRPGHRLMVQVQSSWFPLVDRNPQTFTDIYNANDSDFHKATQRVYRTRGKASRVLLPVLE
jgi:putative CocE/NonD family hydrolase